VLQAILFDLDGTLLQLDTMEFVNEYLREISTAAAPVVEPEHFTKALLASTNVMIQKREVRQTNAEVFWQDFRRRIGEEKAASLEPLLNDFYAHRFNCIARVTRPHDQAGAVVQKALDLGLRIVLATNPVFPESAIRDRMNWAGVGDFPWDLVTTYENMYSSKPHPSYYLEVASRIGVNPNNCLMVGNEMENDIIPAVSASMRTYFVTDDVSENSAGGFGADGCGDLSDLIYWLMGFL
jgi:FMN phosphatase YigB (HAD superfamily)